MPALNLSTLFRRDAVRPTLRQRAAALKASLSQAREQPRPLPEPGSAEAKTAFKAACYEHTIRTQFADEYPELKRTPLEWWTAHSLGKALETGELTPAECARLYPLATERELRMAEIEHELNIAGLFALAYADEYSIKAQEPDPDEAGHDPIFVAIQAYAAAHEAFAATCNSIDKAWRREQGWDTSDETMASAHAAWDAGNAKAVEAWNALFEVRPTTLVGILALIRQAQKWAPENEGVTGSIALEDIFGSIAEGLASICEMSTDPRDAYAVDGRLAFDINAAITGGAEPPAAVPPSDNAQARPSLVGMLDLASATMDELQTIRDVADHVGSTAYAHAWRTCCHLRTHQYGTADYNDAGKLMQWIGDALAAVESAAEKEAQRRVPNNRDDRETRLSMLAVSVIDNGDPEAIEELACELLAHAKVERERG